MKKLLSIFLFCISLTTFSQDIKREEINGKIIVEGNDIEGITIYNLSSSEGTVTNEKGEFTIRVGLNDLIEFRALEYKNFDVVANKAILESKKMNVFLIEEVNKLEEVVVVSKRLTGNLKKDIKTANRFIPKSDVIYFGIKNTDTRALTDNYSNKIRNVTVPQTLVDGLNVINIVDQLLIPLFRSEVKDKKAAGIPEVPSKSIKYYLGSTFLVENFNIPEHRVEEFIRYVEDDTFDFELLNYGHEMEFLELLNTKSKIFLKTKSSTD